MRKLGIAREVSGVPMMLTPADAMRSSCDDFISVRAIMVMRGYFVALPI